MTKTAHYQVLGCGPRRRLYHPEEYLSISIVQGRGHEVLRHLPPLAVLHSGDLVMKVCLARQWRINHREPRVQVVLGDPMARTNRWSR